MDKNETIELALARRIASMASAGSVGESDTSRAALIAYAILRLAEAQRETVIELRRLTATAKQIGG